MSIFLVAGGQPNSTLTHRDSPLLRSILSLFHFISLIQLTRDKTVYRVALCLKNGITKINNIDCGTIFSSLDMTDLETSHNLALLSHKPKRSVYRGWTLNVTAAFWLCALVPSSLTIRPQLFNHLNGIAIFTQHPAVIRLRDFILVFRSKLIIIFIWNIVMVCIKIYNQRRSQMTKMFFLIW